MTKLFILDTMILLQAMLSRNSSAYYVLKKADSLGTLLVSDATLAELEEKIRLPKFDKYQSLNKRLAFYRAYCLLALNLEVSIKIKACRDPKDDKFLELAVTADADCIVSLDADLLVLDPFEGIPILTPAAFLRKFA